MKINNKIMIVFYVFVLSIFVSFFMIRFIGKCYGNTLVTYGEAEARRVVSLIINNSIVYDDYDNLLIVRDNGIDLDTYKVNSLLDSINDRISNNMIALAKGNIENLDFSDIDYNSFKDGFVYYIPMGSLIGSGLISNVGPNIPVKLLLVGDVFSYIDGDVKEYGINNALVEVSVNVRVSVMVSMLFVSKKIDIDAKRVIIMKIIEGKIPNYFFSNGNN